MADLEAHDIQADLALLTEHREIWSSKPVLRRIYAVWFDCILGELPREAAVLEVGAGPGFLADHARHHRPDLRWTSSDLIPTGWNDIVADAARLPIATGSHDAVVGLDTLHHLPDPSGFFTEVGRVLRPRAPLVLVEPWLTPLSYPVYKWFHQEDCDSRIDEWHPFAAVAGKAAFDGNAAIPGRLVKRTSPLGWARFRLSAPRVERMNAFPYLLSLGFRPLSLLPAPLLRPLLNLDRALAPLSALTALRACLIWRRL